MLDAVAAVTTLHTFFGNNAAVIITFDYSYSFLHTVLRSVPAATASSYFSMFYITYRNH